METNPYSEFAAVTINLLMQVKYYHWQTRSESEHRVYDKLIDNLNPLLDDYVETYQGLSGDIVIVAETGLENYNSKEDVIDNLKMYIQYLDQHRESCDKNLVNILDSMAVECAKTINLLYLNGEGNKDKVQLLS